jgi:phosphoserine phosphatase
MKYRLTSWPEQARPAGHPEGDREMGPMAGAREFLDKLREDYQVIILSDTFYEFATR